MHFLAKISTHLASGPSKTITGGIGVSVIVFCFTHFSKFSNLRYETHARLRTPYEIAYAGLTDEALIELEKLGKELNQITLPSSGSFKPERYIGDPALFERSAKKTMDLLRRRTRLKPTFDRLLVICSCLTWFSVLLLVDSLVALALYFFYYLHKAFWLVSFFLDGVTLLILAFLFIAYAFLNAMIQKSIEIANPIREPQEVSSE